MDGFEDNRGIVVLGATNRPGAIDAALIRPGRFDRIIYMPLPDAEGRAKILQVGVRLHEHGHGRQYHGMESASKGCNWYRCGMLVGGARCGCLQKACFIATFNTAQDLGCSIQPSSPFTISFFSCANIQLFHLSSV